MAGIVWAYKSSIKLGGMTLYFVYYASGKKRSFDVSSVPKHVLDWIEQNNPKNLKEPQSAEVNHHDI